METNNEVINEEGAVTAPIKEHPAEEPKKCRHLEQEQLPELPKSVSAIMESLRKAETNVMVAGPCVRDLIMGGTPTIYDMYCNMPSAKVVEYLDAAEKSDDGAIIRIKETEKRKGLWIRIHSLNYPFSDFLMERDYTIHAIGLDPKWGYIDPTGGWEDVKEGVIRTTGNPEDLFMEDAEAMFRAVDLAATYDLEIDKAAKDTIIKRARSLDEPSKVVRTKLMDGLVNMLSSANAGRAVELMLELHLLEAAVGSKRWVAAEHRENMRLLAANIDETEEEMKVRTGLFYAAIGGKQGAAAVNHLPYEKETAEHLNIMLKYLPVLDGVQSIGELKTLMGKVGETGYEYLETMAQAVEIALKRPNKGVGKRAALALEIMESGDPVYRKDLAVSVKDLKAIGIEESAVDKTMAKALEAVHEDPSLNEKERLLQWIQSESKQGFFAKLGSLFKSK